MMMTNQTAKAIDRPCAAPPCTLGFSAMMKTIIINKTARRTTTSAAAAAAATTKQHSRDPTLRSPYGEGVVHPRPLRGNNKK